PEVRPVVPPEIRPGARLGLVIPKRWARRAVERNLVKRQLREAFRQLAATLPAEDFVFRLVRPLPEPMLAPEPAIKVESSQDKPVNESKRSQSDPQSGTRKLARQKALVRAEAESLLRRCAVVPATSAAAAASA